MQKSAHKTVDYAYLVDYALTMNELLEKAKAHKGVRLTKKNFTKDEIGVAVAWAKDEITLLQAAKVFGNTTRIHRVKDYVVSNSNIYTKLALLLREYVKENK